MHQRSRIYLNTCPKSNSYFLKKRNITVKLYNKYYEYYDQFLYKFPNFLQKTIPFLYYTTLPIRMDKIRPFSQNSATENNELSSHSPSIHVTPQRVQNGRSDGIRQV